MYTIEEAEKDLISAHNTAIAKGWPNAEYIKIDAHTILNRWVQGRITDLERRVEQLEQQSKESGV